MGSCCMSQVRESVALRMLQAVSVALREWPDVNASLGEDGQSLLRHHAHNLGVAMATPSGLVVRAPLGTVIDA